MKIQVAQRLGKLQKKGWKPRRTIILCNWDAEEYGIVIFFFIFYNLLHTKDECRIKI